MSELSDSERNQVVEILARRANDIASYKDENKSIPGSVELALTREIQRLRKLADKLKPTPAISEDDE